jgi:hypothetical protein
LTYSDYYDTEEVDSYQTDEPLEPDTSPPEDPDQSEPEPEFVVKDFDPEDTEGGFDESTMAPVIISTGP